MEAVARDPAEDEDNVALQQLTVPVPREEHKRLSVLRQCCILDTEPDEAYDRYTALCRRYFKVSCHHLVKWSQLDVKDYLCNIGISCTRFSNRRAKTMV